MLVRNQIFENERRIHVNEDRHEVFRGHLEECLQHLGTSLASSAPKGSRGAALVRKPVADFCGVEIDSVTRWFHGTAFPIGESLIKLMCYLDMVGYRVIELERMPQARRNFMELVGYGLLSIDQVVEFLGYSSTSHIFQVLQGRQDVNKDKNDKMWEMWKARKEELQRKKEKSQVQYRLDISLKVCRKAESPETSARVSASRPTAVVSIMEGLLNLLEENSFEKLSDGDLADFLKSADTVLRLSARLSALSSWLIMSKQQRKGGS